MTVVGLIFFFFAVNVITDLADIRTGQVSIVILVLEMAFSLALLAVLSQLYKNYKKSVEIERVEAVNIRLEQEKRDDFVSNAQKAAVDKPIKLTYLGGSGLDLAKQTSVSMFLYPSSILLMDEESLKQIQLDFVAVTSIEVSGPGTETTNAGITGGGFGIAGFIQGAAIAAVANKLTSSSTTNTFLRILGTSMEGYFHTGMMNPDQLRLVLSPLVVSIEKGKHQSGKPLPSTSLADEISKLNLLVKDGTITSEEFATAKKKLIEG